MIAVHGPGTRDLLTSAEGRHLEMAAEIAGANPGKGKASESLFRSLNHAHGWRFTARRDPAAHLECSQQVEGPRARSLGSGIKAGAQGAA